MLGLGACGFAPVYGPGGAASELSGALSFKTPETELGFRVSSALQDRLGSAETAKYEVTITLSETQSEAAVTADGDTNRFDLTGIGNWQATPSSGGTPVTGRVQSFTSYAATGTTVATQAAERNARARLAQILADQIATDLIIALGSSS